ncbi:Tripartite tricarboxylate transporter TctB family protein [Nitratireductor basaltis]|uniref:Tripartite tricarboxylate transporter TctB family protein n=2 Tax=Nitratireductor basaltis TaxID=472175 RepID=A0A084U5F6_9HYPH|nr:Tripartite tricarboxylate transporter TctB family protein [Nitratireductor basaltis]
MKLTDALTGALIACLGIFMVHVASGFPSFPGQPYGASLLPTLLGVGFIATGLLLLLRDMRQRFMSGVRKGASVVSLDEGLQTRDGAISAILIIATVVLQILLAPHIGFIPVSLATLFCLFVWFRVPWLAAIAVSIFGTALCWWLFAIILKVPLARGFLEGII